MPSHICATESFGRYTLTLKRASARGEFYATIARAVSGTMEYIEESKNLGRKQSPDVAAEYYILRAKTVELNIEDMAKV